MSPLFETRGVTKQFGGLVAVETVDLDVEERTIVSIIGPNGAGKTTFFNCVTGFYRPEKGVMLFEGQSLVGLRPDQITSLGLARTYQNIRVFAGMTAMENVLVGQHRLLENNAIAAFRRLSSGIVEKIRQRKLHVWYGILGAVLVLLYGILSLAAGSAAGTTSRPMATIPRFALGIWAIPLVLLLLATAADLFVEASVTLLRFPTHETEAQAVERAKELLELVRLTDEANTLARNLPYGDQRRLEIARALASDPRLLLLDEPTAGMNPRETAEMMAFIQRLRDEFDLSIILIEHDMKVVMGISDRVSVLDYGKKIAEGTPAEVQRDPRVIEAYLGQEA